jgi:hypothetical protein
MNSGLIGALASQQKDGQLLFLLRKRYVAHALMSYLLQMSGLSTVK